ncbi:MAG: hypothetical protein IJ489_11430 [Clostridia bacterium]|nr:hypothetical protein [Clostridia bacterium]
MNYQKNLKYFKSTDTHYYIGLPIFILGAIFFVMAYIFWTYLFWYQDFIGIALMIIGAMVAFIPRSFRSSEKDIDDAVAEMTKDYETNTAEELGLTSELLREQKPLLVGTYTYEDGSLYRRGKTDRKFRSDRYTAAAILFTRHGICISEKQFSLIDDTVTENTHEFHYTDIDGLFIETNEHRFTNGEKTATANLLVKTDGKTIFSLPVTQNATLDRTCEEINLRIKRIKKA